MLLYAILSIWLGLCNVVDAKAVFAHFMLQNAESFKVPQWEQQIQLAKDAHIDGFALNFVWPWDPMMTQMSYAFTAANNKGFKLIFSFDYAASDPDYGFPKDKVIELLKIYGPNYAYFKHSTGQPLVSTFEGPQWYADWPEIKKATNAFFVPSYSSLGARRAMTTGVVDGLFSWGAWPEGPNNMNTEIDASYKEFLNGKTYMMPVSPWFYTNMPGFDKNWVWRGDSLWGDRWRQVWFRQPEYVQIISWNDYGESHYIGPLDESQYEAFDRGLAPYNYVRGMPHDAWRLLLPYAIDTYKNGVANIDQEILVGWYRLSPARACNTGGTTGNTKSQVQTEYHPAEIIQDRIFFAAQLGSNADVAVTIGGQAVSASFTRKPTGTGIGLYQGSAEMGGKTGTVVISVIRNGVTRMQMTGQAITTACNNPGGLNNFNAWTGSAFGTKATNTPPALSKQNCTEGFGKGDYNELCEYTCKYGYCPEVCTCSSMGALLATPKPKNVDGFPKPGQLCGFKGLCSFGCNYEKCPAARCTTDPSAKDKCAMPVELPLPPLPAPGSGSGGPFVDDGCRKGTGPGNIEGLCDFSCWRGYCPDGCTCTSREGAPNPRGVATRKSGYAIQGMNTRYTGLCNFTSWYNYVPPEACTQDPRFASSLYTGMPALSEQLGRPTVRALEEEEWNKTQPETSVGLYRRQSDPKEVENYQRMTRDWLWDKYCGPNCSDCLLGGAKDNDWMCLALIDRPAYCNYLNSTARGMAKWKMIDNRTGSRFIVRNFDINNGDDLGNPYALKGDYKNDLMLATSAMWGGRDTANGIKIHSLDWTCDKINSKSCGKLVSEFSCLDVSIPAYPMFAAQIKHINAYFSDMWLGITVAQVNTVLSVDKIVKLFVAENDSSGLNNIFKAIGAALGIIGIVGVAGTLSAGLATVAGAAGAMSGALGGVTGLADIISPDKQFEDTLEKSISINDKLEAISEQLRKSVQSMLASTFSGSRRGNFALESLLVDGYFSDHMYDVQEMSEAFTTALKSQLIAPAWKLGVGVVPVLALREGKNLGFPERFDDAPKYSFQVWMTDKPDKVYTAWLIDIGTCKRDNSQALPTPCDRYKGLKGFEDLEKVAGIKPLDMVVSTYTAWEKRREDSEWKLDRQHFYDWDNFESSDDETKMARIPGVYDIPVCEWGVIEANMVKPENLKGNAFNPCA